jgi:hypothetical protein
MRAMHITHMHHTCARFLPAVAAGAVRQRSEALAQAPQNTPSSWLVGTVEDSRHRSFRWLGVDSAFRSRNRTLGHMSWWNM